MRRTLLGLAALLAGVPSALQAQSIQQHFFGNAIEAGVIAIDGEMERGLTARLKALDQESGLEARRVVLNSPGGSLIEGIELGRWIRQRGLSTEVGTLARDRDDPTERSLKPGDCSSACALAFLGGNPRLAKSAPMLGFHQFHEGGSVYSGYALSPSEVRAEGLSHAQLVSGLIVSYMVEMGADARLFTVSALAGAGEMIRLTEQDAIDFGIVTPHTFDTWVLEPYRSGVVAASKRLTPTGPYDLVTQSTAFCRTQDKSARLMMTVPATEDWNAERFGAFDVSATVLSLDSQERYDAQLPASSVRFFGSGDAARLEITLDRALAQRIQSAQEFGLQLNVGRALGGYRVLHVLSPRDRSLLDAAFRLCI